MIHSVRQFCMGQFLVSGFLFTILIPKPCPGLYEINIFFSCCECIFQSWNSKCCQRCTCAYTCNMHDMVISCDVLGSIWIFHSTGKLNRGQYNILHILKVAWVVMHSYWQKKSKWFYAIPIILYKELQNLIYCLFY